VSFSRIGTVAHRALQQLWHDKRLLLVMLTVPSLAMVLFGYSFSGDVRGIHIAVLDEDQTDLTASIIENLEGDPAFVVTVVHDPALDLEDWLLHKGYRAIIRFPKKFTSLYYAHFAMGVATTSQGTIQLTADESDPQVAATIGKGLSDALLNVGEGGPVAVEKKELYGVKVRFIDSFAPAIIGLVVAFNCTMLTLMAVVREKVDGTFARIWVSPVRRAEFILGYIAAFSLVALAQSTLVLTIGRALFHILINGSLLFTFFSIILMAIGSVGLGTLLSAIARNESQAVVFFPLIMIPSFLLSGMMWPIEAIPMLLRPVCYVVPLTYSNRLLRAVMVKGLLPWQEPVGFAGVATFVVLTIVLASVVLRQSAQD